MQRFGVVSTDWRPINLTFLVSRAFFLSTGVLYVCELCIWALGLHIDGGAAGRKLRKRHAFSLGASAEKQDGQAHLKILS